MIKYLGSKRRLVPVLVDIARAVQAERALDLFTGTTRVAQAFRGDGLHVTAVDNARYAHAFAQTYIATDLDAARSCELTKATAALDALPGRPGYVTEVFCRASRFFTPENGARIDAVRAAIAERHAGSWLEPLLLTALVEAADRVDSTTGVQMAYLKTWAPRARQPLRLRVPEVPAGPVGCAVLGDAAEAVHALGPFDLAYLDPPYNQHRYLSNYHVWETVVAADEPEHYGVACKRTDLRSDLYRTAFDDRRRLPAALAACIADVDARVVVVSGNDETWVSLDELVAWCEVRGRPEVLAFDGPRYVGARIGVHDRTGRVVGLPGRLRNVEHVVVTGDLSRAERARLRAARQTHAAQTSQGVPCRSASR